MSDFTPSIVTPSLQGYTGQEPFRFWCQMALPFVYDDTLSYYELLNKVVVYLNNTISDVATAEENIEAINNATNTNIAALLQSYRQLQEYVNDYFTNLDVQQEINIKLDDMATSGELSNLLSPFIPDLVTNWLTANVNPVGSAVVVDSSLSVSGAAADAKKTGEGISGNKNGVENNYADNVATANDKSLLVGKFVNGAIRESDGGLITYDYKYRVASEDYFNFPHDVVLYVSSGFNGRVAFYDNSDTLTGLSSLTNNAPLGIAKNTKFRLTIKRDSETTSEVANIAEFRSSVYYFTEATKNANTTESEFNSFCNCSNSILPSADTFVDGTILASTGGISNYNGWFTSPVFVKMPEYSSGFRTVYQGTNAFVAVYTAPNESAFVERLGLSSGKLDVNNVGGKYLRFSFLGSVSSNYSQIEIKTNDPAHTENESIKNDVTGSIIKRVGIITKPTVKQHGAVLATTADLQQGDTLVYSFKVTRIGYISIKDFNNNTLQNIGLTSPDASVIDRVYSGSFTIPAKFNQIVVYSNIEITKFEKQSISTDIKNAIDNNNTNKGFINGTVNTQTGELWTTQYLRRIVKKNIEYTNHVISLNVIDYDYYTSVFFYDESGTLLNYTDWSYHALIPANSYYRVGIRKVTEDDNLADIATFAAAINFQNNITIDYPLTYSPSYISGALSYCPLGKLSKPYICFSCDDGRSELATYTIPMFIDKAVPLTMCLWSTSAVMTNSTYRAQVISAVSNNGFEVAQHGEHPWANGSQMNTPYDEKTLTQFWEREKVAFSGLGVTVAKSAAYPYGYTNQRVIAQSGGYFGVNRSVYNPTDRYIVKYPDLCCGERSNVYALRAANINYYDLSNWQRIIDYTIANSTLLCIYFHDWDLTTAQKEVLESVIDYAKAQDMTFCNLSDIPNLV